MATVRDYVGQQFGTFRIGEPMARGKEAEVLSCQHTGTNRLYVLRLDVKHAPTWSGVPQLPPQNADLERPNCRGTWAMAPSYYQRSLESRRVDKEAFVMRTAPIYGVLTSRYLVPVASPIRVKRAWDIDEVFRASPADDLYLFELWEDLVLSMISGAYESDTPSSAWRSMWTPLTGGSILARAMKSYLEGGTLSKTQKLTVMRNIARSDGNGPEFAENCLVRLCGCVSRGRMTVEQARATLRCVHFRLNVTLHELQQMLASYAAITANVGAETSRQLLTFVMTELTAPPIDEFEQPEDFEVREKEPDVSRFSLFLQGHAGLSQEVLSLTRS